MIIYNEPLTNMNMYIVYTDACLHVVINECCKHQCCGSGFLNTDPDPDDQKKAGSDRIRIRIRILLRYVLYVKQNKYFFMAFSYQI